MQSRIFIWEARHVQCIIGADEPLPRLLCALGYGVACLWGAVSTAARRVRFVCCALLRKDDAATRDDGARALSVCVDIACPVPRPPLRCGVGDGKLCEHL